MSKLYRAQYFCICEGQQEELYLVHLGALLKTWQSTVKFKHGRGAAADLKRGEPFGYDKAVLFDHDCEEEQFVQQIKNCDTAEKRRENRKAPHTYHAYSNLNFDLWLALHSPNYKGVGAVHKTDAYHKLVRACFGLDAEANIKEERVIRDILKQITLDNVKLAIHRAEQIRSQKLESDKHQTGNTDWYENPDFSIDKFLKNVLKDAGETF